MNIDGDSALFERFYYNISSNLNILCYCEGGNAAPEGAVIVTRGRTSQ
jgi:hypothetical protein